MQIIIQNEEFDVLVNTVSLARNNKNPDNVYLFRCPYCSEPFGTQIQGVVVKISPGIEPSLNVPTLHLCKKCKRLYMFQTLNDMDRDLTKVVLVSFSNAPSFFYCYLCRKVILQVVGERVLELPNLKLLKIPFTFKCSTHGCPANYLFSDIVVI